MSSNFIDYVKIYTRSGSGGAGSVHFRREKFVAKGGPDGGDGGRGGHIIIKGNQQLWTLLHLKYRKHVIAGNGVNGEGSLREGANGQDEILEVPLGTIARNADSNDIIAEITEEGQEEVITEGGKGGLGNDCRKIYFIIGCVGCKTKNCRLSLYYSGTESWCNSL
jgi:GTP-binding protein